MAKPPVNTSKTLEEKEPSALMQPGAGLPAELQERFQADAGRGTSQRTEDNIVPLVYILQAQSPQVLPKNPNYIDKAAASDIWLRNARVPIVDGEEGMIFQSCHFGIEWVEWQPNRGGFVGRHAALPADASSQPDARNANRITYVRKNGNEVVETRYHRGFVIGGAFGLKDYPDLVMPYVIPFSGTGHTVSRQWMSLMNQFVPTGGKKPAPSWARYYHLTTRLRKNAQGEWYGWDVADWGWVPDLTAYDRGAALCSQFETGERQAEAEERGGSTDDGGAAAEAAGI